MKPKNQETLWNGVAAFLRQHLGDPLAANAGDTKAAVSEAP